MTDSTEIVIGQGNPDLLRLNVPQLTRVANLIAESAMFQSKNRSMTPTEVFSIILIGQSLGLAPGPAMLNFHMIEGRPEMSANLQAAFLKSSGKYDYRLKHERNEDGEYVSCSIDVIDVRLGEIIGNSTFTLEDARRAGLVHGVNWKKYGGNMLMARAISNALAWHAPDAVPFRVYTDGETSGVGEATGVQAVEDEPVPSPARVEAIVTDALAPDEEVIEDAEIVGETPDPDERFTLAAIETRLRADLPHLDAQQKAKIKTSVVELHHKPWSHKSIAELIQGAGFSDVTTWVAFLETPEGFIQDVVASPANPDNPPPWTPGDEHDVSSRVTGSQTAPVINDLQVRMLHARFGECSFSQDEKRYFLRNYAQVESTRDIKAADLDDILAVLRDIQQGDPETRQAYLGGTAA
jgi:hypothetical protein